jgi:glycosyltransferase involved in cell wall biosynthesis
LLITGEFPPMQGGVGDYTRELGLALRELGCRVGVLTATAGGPVPGLEVSPMVGRWGWGCWGTILDVVRRERPDVIHVQYQAAAYGMQPAINLLPRRLRLMGDGRPRIAVTFHDLKVPYLFPKAGRVRRWIVNELARGSDLAIVTNRDDLEAMQRVLAGRTAPALALVPIGSNITPVQPLLIGGRPYERDAWRARWGAGPGDVLLSFFGFVNDRKGVDTLLQALQRLSAGPLSGARLLMIGGQTGSSDPTNVAYLARIHALVDELGLADRVRWTGFTPAEEVTASFWAADLCVLPYRDGASLLHGTLHAALAHGVPIVTTRPRRPLPELVDGATACLVPPEDPDALAAAISRLAADPSLRATLAAGACRLAEQFRWPKIAAETLGLYSRL